MQTALLLSVAVAGQLLAGELRTDVQFTEPGPAIIGRDIARFGWKYKAPEIDLKNESFTVLVPASYRAEEPHGLLVYISPSPGGLIGSPTLDTKALGGLLAERRLLYVGPNQAPNHRPPMERLQLALAAEANMRAQYIVDRQRVIVAGFSGGGKMACIAGRFAPHIFTGVVAIGGCGFHQPVPAGPGKAYAPDMRLSSKHERDCAKRVALALITGAADFNHAPTLAINSAFQKARFRTLLIDLPGLGHEIPGPDAIGQALDFVSPLAEP